jgi:catechol 2,3-dioxygenase
MSISVLGVGHAVVKVQNLDRAARFYCEVLGLREVARRDFGEGPMAFLSTGHSHHDLGLVEIGSGALPPEGNTTGLHHLALRIGDDVGQLREAKAHLEAHGVPVRWALDHRVSQGIYVTDPDGTLLELYVEGDGELWRADPALVATSEPLEL